MVMVGGHLGATSAAVYRVAIVAFQRPTCITEQIKTKTKQFTVAKTNINFTYIFTYLLESYKPFLNFKKVFLAKSTIYIIIRYWMIR